MANVTTILTTALWMSINGTNDARSNYYAVPYGNIVCVNKQDDCYTYTIGMEPRHRKEDDDYWRYVAEFNARKACIALGIDDADINVRYDLSDDWGDGVVEITLAITVKD